MINYLHSDSSYTTLFRSLGSSAEPQARKIAPHRHRDLYHWRLHVTIVRNETLARLAQMEKEAPASVPLSRRSASGHRE